MKRRFMTVSCTIVMALISCQNSDTRYLSGKDSTDILKTVLDDKDFKKDLETEKDTLYILKTEKYNKSWPSGTETFKVEFIEDSKDNRIINKGPDLPYDGRVRLSIPSFYKKADTVFLSVADVGYETSYIFKLIQRDNIWQIVDRKHLIN